MIALRQFKVALGLSVITGLHPAFADLSESDCIVEPHIAVDLSTSVDGIVESISVDRGDIVKAGQILVNLESGVEKSAVNLARTRAQETTEVELAEGRLRFAQRKQDRIEQLLQDEAVSEFAKDEADLEAEMAALELKLARDNRQRAQIELERAVEILNLRVIRSPIDGVVVDRIAAPGEAIGEQQTILLRLVQVNPLNVELIVPADQFGSIKKRNRLQVELSAPVQGLYEADVVMIDPVIDASSSTFGVRALLPNPDYLIPAGISCTAIGIVDERTVTEVMPGQSVGSGDIAQ